MEKESKNLREILEEEKARIHGSWLSENTMKTKHPLVRLHNEVLDFCNYVAPTRNELAQRENALKLITDYIKELWPESEVKAFGSYATGLFLPDSDIDVAIVVKNENDSKSLIKKLSGHLKEKNAISEQEEILGAKVPILKIVEKSTSVSLDISFNILDGCKSIEPIKSLLRKFPQLKPLVLVIKTFLRERKLNETYRGGIGSFLVILMVVAFLQYQCKDKGKKLKEMNLGELIVAFFRFYGAEFNHEMLGISVIGEGAFYKKNTPDQALSLINPQDPEIDLGKSVRQYNEVVKAFQFASDLLRYAGGSLTEIIHSYPGRKQKITQDAGIEK